MRRLMWSVVRIIFYLLLAIGLLGFFLVLHGQSQIKAEVDRVQIPVLVTDNTGRYIGGLERGGCGAFRIWEDQVEQEILSCSVEDAPVSVVIVFDNSGSMRPKTNIARTALSEFVKFGNSQDEYSLVVFDGEIEGVTAWVKPEDITNALLTITHEPEGTTALLDAIYLGISQAKSGRYTRKIVIVLTDGGDNHSRYNENDVKHAFKESDIQFFGIGLFECNFKINSECQWRTHEERFGPTLLAELADLTGGVSYMVAPNNNGQYDSKQLNNLCEYISQAIRDQYVLTYRPISSKMHDGKYHKIKVRVKEPRGSHLGILIPYTREGYRSPAQ